VQLSARKSVFVIFEGDSDEKIGCGFFVSSRRALTSLHHFISEAGVESLESLNGSRKEALAALPGKNVLI